MKRTNIAALALVVLCGCSTQDVVIARISLDPSLQATCVIVRVRPPGGEAQLEKKLLRGSGASELQASITRGSLPQDVLVSAQPLYGDGCSEPIFANGHADEQSARFSSSGGAPVELHLVPPPPEEDTDGDGFAGSQATGPDCRDSDPGFHPGATEQCQTGLDLDCNGMAGCNDPACSGKACTAPPASLGFATPAQQLTAGACSRLVIVQSRDGAGQPRIVAADTAVTLSTSASTGVIFYSDPTCSNAITETRIAAGTSSSAVYFRSTVSGTVTLIAVTPGVVDARQAQTIRPAAPSAVGFSTPVRTAAPRACSNAVSVVAQDSYGNATRPESPVSIALSSRPTGGLSFYSDAGCTTPVSNLTLTTDGTPATFYFSGQNAGAYQITATSSSLGAATQSAVLGSASPVALGFATPPQTVRVGSCSGVVTVEARDVNATPIPVTAATPVSLTGGNGMLLFRDSACTAAITSATIANGATSTSFYFKGANPGPATLIASATGLGSVNQTETFTSGNVGLAFATAVQTQPVGACMGPATVQVRDGNSTPINVTSATAVQLSGSLTGTTFYSDSACTAAVTSITIASGTDSATFYAKSTSAGSLTLTATASGLPSAQQTWTVTAGQPADLVFLTPSQTLPAGACSSAVTVQTQDSFNNPAPVSSATQLLLQSYYGGLSYYSDSGCTAAISTLTLAAGTSTGTFYFKGTYVGAAEIFVYTNLGLGGVNQSETITAGPPDSIVFVSGSQAVTTNRCSGSVNLQIRDAAGNGTDVSADTQVNLSAAPATGFTFYSDSNCTAAITRVTVPLGDQNATFYFMGTTANSVTITASATGLKSATQSETVAIPVASQLAFTSAQQTLTAGQCSAAFAIQSRDNYGTPTNVTSSTTVYVQDYGYGGATFYANAGCSGAAISTVTIPAGGNSATFYAKFTQSGGSYVEVYADSLSGSGQSVTINAGPPSALFFPGSSQSVAAGQCSPGMQVELRDSFGNPVNVSSNTPVTLSASPSTNFNFYSDWTCTTPISSVNIPNGQSQAYFYFSGLTGGTFTVSASGTGVSTAAQTQTIVGMMRQGSCSIPANGSSVTCTISPQLNDTNRAFIVFQATASDVSSGATSVSCVISNSNTVTCSRAATAPTAVNINWYIPQFVRQMSVQHYTVPCTGSSTTLTLNSPVSSMSDTFVLASSVRGGTDLAGSALRTVQLTSTSTVDISIGGSCASGESTDIQVVELPGASVIRGTTGFVSGTSKVVSSLPAASLGSSFLLYSYRSSSTSSSMCERALRGELTSTTSITFSRGNASASNCAASPLDEISFERVVLPASASVQSAAVSFGAGSGTASATLGTAVDTTRALVLAGGQWSGGQAQGEGSYDQATAIGDVRARPTLTSSTGLQLVRESTNGSAKFTPFVLQLSP